MRAKRQLSPKEALAKAEELCARAEHSSGEIRDKLYRWGVSAGDSDKIIASLTAHRFIDDERFAAAFIHDKIEYNGWGRRKIALALYQKRVDRDIIDTALGEVDMDRYTTLLSEIIAQRARTMPDADTYEGRTRLFRFAASRGFEPDLISAVIRAMKD